MEFLEITHYFFLGVIVAILSIFAIRFGFHFIFNLMKKKLFRTVTR